MHVAIGDHSRVAYVEMLAADDGPTATEFVARAQAWCEGKGVITRRVLTDNGGGYVSDHFAHMCDHLRIKRRRTKPYRPRTNGNAERLIQTLLRECIYRFSYHSSSQRQQELNLATSTLTITTAATHPSTTILRSVAFFGTTS